MKENIVLEKAYDFALHVVRLYRKLTNEKHEYVLSKTLLGDGTNIGAYIESAQEADSREGFWRDMKTALAKAGRTKYWLNVLHDGGFLDDAEFQPAYDECLELKRMLGKITNSTKSY